MGDFDSVWKSVRSISGMGLGKISTRESGRVLTILFEDFRLRADGQTTATASARAGNTLPTYAADFDLIGVLVYVRGHVSSSPAARGTLTATLLDCAESLQWDSTFSDDTGEGASDVLSAPFRLKLFAELRSNAPSQHAARQPTLPLAFSVMVTGEALGDGYIEVTVESLDFELVGGIASLGSADADASKP